MNDIEIINLFTQSKGNVINKLREFDGFDYENKKISKCGTILKTIQYKDLGDWDIKKKMVKRKEFDMFIQKFSQVLNKDPMGAIRMVKRIITKGVKIPHLPQCMGDDYGVTTIASENIENGKITYNNVKNVKCHFIYNFTHIILNDKEIEFLKSIFQ